MENIFKKKLIAVSKEPIVEINRLKELKQLKQLANNYLIFYLEHQKLEKNSWKKDLSDRNILLLKKIINKLNKLQHNDRIAEYLEAIKPTPALNNKATVEEKNKAHQKYLQNFGIIFGQGNFFSL